MKIKDVICEEAYETYADLSARLDNENQAREQQRIAKLDKSYENVHSLLTTRCQPYLSAIGGVHNALFDAPMYRGVHTAEIRDMGMSEVRPMFGVNVRNDREPKDTPLVIHQKIDNWFQQQTGYKFRSAGLFCTGSEKVAAGYGYTCVVVPVGEFHYCWSPHYSDLFEQLEEYASKKWHSDVPVDISWKQKTVEVFSHDEILNEFLEAGNYYFDSGLFEGIESHSEIMIVCREAYIVDLNWCKMMNLHFLKRGSTQ